MSSTLDPDKIALGQIEPINISNVVGLQDALDAVDPVPDPYVHPTQSIITIGPLTGNQVIESITVNALGHTTSIATRVITAVNIGAQPLGNYEVLANKSTNVNLGNSDTLYSTQKAVKAYVDSTATTIQAITINTTDGIQGGGNLTANRTFSLTSDVVREANANVITGLKDTRRAGPNDGSNFAEVKTYSIGNDNLYKLHLRNTQNTIEVAGQVGWHYAYTYNASAGIPRTKEVLGFAPGAIIVIGDKDLSTTIQADVSTQENANIADVNYRYPLRQYIHGSSQIENGLIIGTDQVKNTKIDSSTKLYIEGGIRTLPADATEATILFGEYEASANATVDTIWKVKVGDKLLEIKARDITPI